MCTKRARTFYNSFLSPLSSSFRFAHAHTPIHPHPHTHAHGVHSSRSRGAASRDGSGTTHRPAGSPGVTCLEAASQRKSRSLRYGVWIKYYFRAYTPAGRDGRRRLPGTPSSPRLKRTWRGKTPANWLTRGDMGELRWSLVCPGSEQEFRVNGWKCIPFFFFFYFILFYFFRFAFRNCCFARNFCLTVFVCQNKTMKMYSFFPLYFIFLSSWKLLEPDFSLYEGF